MAEENQTPPALQFIRGTGLQNDYYTGPEGSLSVDVDKQQLRLHDGVTQGGHSLKGFPEAPKDGVAYVRKDGEWVSGVAPTTALPEIPETFNDLTRGRAFTADAMGAYIDDDNRLWVAGQMGDSFNPEWTSNETWVEVIPGVRFSMVTGSKWYGGFIALDTTGVIWVAGTTINGMHGYLGSGSQDEGYTWPPRPFNDDDDWIFIHGTEYYGVFGIKEDGSLWGWGSNTFDQLGLGYGSNDTFITPQRVDSSNSWLRIESELWRTVGFKNDGRIYMWGADVAVDNSGASPALADQPTPLLIDTYPAVTNYTPVSASSAILMWIKNDGTAWYRGYLESDIFPANGSEVFEWTQLGTDTDWAFTSVPDAWGFFILVKQDGTAWAWGGSRYEYPIAVPLQIVSDDNIVSVVTAYENVFYLMSDTGNLYSYGEGWGGQLGNGTEVGKWDVASLILTDVDWVDGKYWNTIARLKDGTYMKWGTNYDSSLGCPVTSEILTPIPIDSCPVVPVV